MAGGTYRPGEMAARGEAIYRERIQHLTGTAKRGRFVVIDVESGDYEVDTGDAAATRRLLDRRPDAGTYAVRVGHFAAYSYVGDSGSPGLMVGGGANVDRQVLGTIDIVDAEGRLRPVEVLFDIHFTGCLTLSAETVQQLGLSSVGRRSLEPSNGEWSESEAYIAAVSWHGYLTDVLVLESDCASLLGMTLLWGGRDTPEIDTQGTSQNEIPNLVPSTETPKTETGLLGRLKGRVQSSLFVILVTIVGTVTFIAMLYGIDSLSLNFGEIITFMGIWLAIGVLFGQNKTPAMPLKRYMGRRFIGVACCYALFFVITLIYELRNEGTSEAIGGWELFGLLVLSLVGFAIGFFAGQDKEPQQ